MINPQELDPHFLKALEQSWDERAIWPGCKDAQGKDTGPACYGQCLVGVLNAWVAHGGEKSGYHLVTGITYGPGLPEHGVWHFQLAKILPDSQPIPIDVTWHQFQEGCKFVAAVPGSDHFNMIMQGSLLDDSSLKERVGIISANLALHGFEQKMTSQEIVDYAKGYYGQLAGKSRIDASAPSLQEVGFVERVEASFPALSRAIR